jgi:hypothetical protein
LVWQNLQVLLTNEFTQFPEVRMSPAGVALAPSEPQALFEPSMLDWSL